MIIKLPSRQSVLSCQLRVAKAAGAKYGAYIITEILILLDLRKKKERVKYYNKRDETAVV